jgi:hypothetical protein
MTPIHRFLLRWVPPGFALVLLAAIYLFLLIVMLITFEAAEDATMIYWNG